MKKSFSFPAYLIVSLMLAGSVTLLSACGGSYGTSSPSSSSSSSSGSSSGSGTSTSSTCTLANNCLTQANITSAQQLTATYGPCDTCHTLTKLGWTGSGGPSLSTIGSTKTLSSIENYVSGMPANGSPSLLPTADVQLVSEYIAYESGSTSITTGQ